MFLTKTFFEQISSYTLFKIQMSPGKMLHKTYFMGTQT